MKTYIVLLKGINVGGQKKIKMADLKLLLEKAGFGEIRTYIQSGNLIFKSTMDSQEIAERIHQIIKHNYGFEMELIILTKDNLDQILSNNPFVSIVKDISKLHVTLLREHPDNDKVTQIRDYEDEPNEFVIRDNLIYLYCPDGYGRVKINNTFFERKLKVGATTRNWKTMLALSQFTS